MAITVKQADENLKNIKLTAEQLEIISDVEDYIDEKIKDDYIGDDVYLSTDFVRFRANIQTNAYIYFGKKHLFLMYEELKKRYNNAGWTLNYSDGRCILRKNKSESKLKPYTFYINKMANGGGIGGTSDSADMNAPMIGGTMSSSMFEGGSYDNKFENKLWNEIADGTPHSFKKGGKVEDCGCKEKYDEGGNAECGCWHYDIGGL